MAASSVTLDPMSGGEKVYTDKIGTDHIQGMKLILGDLGTNDSPVSSANPMPVAIDAGDDIATATNQTTMIGHLDGVEGSLTTITGHVDGIEGLLTTIDADTGAILLAVDGLEALLTTIDADTGVLAATDFATEAKQDTIIGHVDGIEGLLTTIDADTGGMATSLDNIEASVGIMDDWDNAASDGVSVSGDVAHDAADAGEPVKVGYKAIAHGANPTAVAANDRTNGYANRHGIPWVIGGHPNIVTIEASYTAAQTNAAIVSVSAGTKIVVTQLQVTADNANTVDTGFRVGFATATTPTTTGVVGTHPGLARGSVYSRGDGSGIIGVGADDEDLRITSEVPTGGSIRVLVSYYTIES